MKLVVADWETFFDSKEFTLSKLSTEAYVRDPRFEAHGVAIKWSADTPAQWYDERRARFVLKEHDWSDTLMVHHHANFDSLIESHHYGVHPKMIGCTLSMARLLLGNHIGVSLDSVREQFGFPKKITPYTLFDGKHWNELSPAVQQQIADGACDEVESIWKLFGVLLQKGFPRSELEIVDTTVKMFSEPCLRADMDLLARIWKTENDEKQRRLKELNVDPKELSSSDKFAALLRIEGVEPATKTSPSNPDKQIWAFAKTDPFMQDLLEDENERLRTLAEARLGIKSTLLQTRAETIGFMARRGPLCVYLRMYGAHTTRWSGGDGSNFQNLKKSDPDFPADGGGLNIREALLAPEGYLLGAIDASQIECRILNYVAGQDDVIENFREHRDPYLNVASQFYGFPVTKEHKTERNVGKVLELQAGYGSGGDKIRATLRTKAGIILSPADGLKARDAYRETHPQVVALWGTGGRMLARLAGGSPLEWGPTLIKDGQIILPNGAPLQFGTIEYYRDNELGDSYWRIKTRRGWSKLYGAKLVENLIQALARVVMSDAMLRIKSLGYRIVTTTHDELVVLIKKDGNEQRHLDICTNELKRAPIWLPGIPLDADGVMSERYAK